VDYEVIIIGAGPAGIFAALELARLRAGRVLLLERGKCLKERCQRTGEDVLRGWGGAGAFSDGKLTLSPEVGGHLGELIAPDQLLILLEQTDRIYVAHGAPDRIYGEFTPRMEELGNRARRADLELIPMRIRHIGTENCPIVLDRLRQALEGRVEMRSGCPAEQILTEGSRVTGVRLSDGTELHCRQVIAAPGRSGAGWMKQQADRLGLKSKASPVDIGVRVELPAVVFKDITDAAYESKLIHYSKTFDDKVRTFCMNPYGEVVTERANGLITVNGHSYAGKKSANTNFAVLVSSAFTEPFDDPIAYGLYIARLANLLGKGAIVQRLGDLLSGRRSTRERMAKCLTRPTLTDATPGDLSFVFPFRHLQSIIEMLAALEVLAPGVYSRHTLLYGVEVKFYSNRIAVSSELETEISGLFAIGDGAGITRGLLQASASGLLAARAAAGRLQ